jgi:hypothetical protein
VCGDSFDPIRRDHIYCSHDGATSCWNVLLQRERADLLATVKMLIKQKDKCRHCKEKITGKPAAMSLNPRDKAAKIVAVHAACRTAFYVELATA